MWRILNPFHLPRANSFHLPRAEGPLYTSLGNAAGKYLTKRAESPSYTSTNFRLAPSR
jgi:hypothetical protein